MEGGGKEGKAWMWRYSGQSMEGGGKVGKAWMWRYSGQSMEGRRKVGKAWAEQAGYGSRRQSRQAMDVEA
jgi:hypothetical protein